MLDKVHLLNYYYTVQFWRTYIADCTFTKVTLKMQDFNCNSGIFRLLILTHLSKRSKYFFHHCHRQNIITVYLISTCCRMRDDWEYLPWCSLTRRCEAFTTTGSGKPITGYTCTGLSGNYESVLNHHHCWWSSFTGWVIKQVGLHKHEIFTVR